MRDHFKVASLDGFGLQERNAAIGAAGGMLHYLTQHLRRDVANLTRLSFYRRNDYLALDYTTLRHLEILEPLHHDAPRNGVPLRRAESHGNADGRAAIARLAFATAGGGRADSTAAGGGANVRGAFGVAGKISRATRRACAIWSGRLAG